MGKNVIVADMRGDMENFMDGMVESDNFFQLRKCNCSGRFSKTPISREQLHRELDRYKKGQGARNRKLILDEHHVKIVVYNILERVQTA